MSYKIALSFPATYSRHKWSNPVCPNLLSHSACFSNVFMVVGGDDLISDNSDLRDSFVGIGLRFNEDSLKPILSSLPLSQ